MTYFKNTSFLIMILFILCCRKSGDKDAIIYMDSNATIEDRTEDLLARMTLEEKVAQMCQYVGLEHMRTAENNLSKEELLSSDAHGFYPGLHSSDIEAMVEKGLIGSFLHVLNLDEANHLQKLAQKSRLKIPLLIGIDAIHGTALVDGATIYPTPIGLASTWDTALVKKISQQTAVEMRATGSAWTFAPNIDVARDARWGRVGETFGEDPFLVGVMGSVMIKGLQDTDNPDKYKVVACAKHLIAGSESVNGLNGAPTDLSERTIREIYLPPYKAAVDAGVFTMMTAHNELNGIPCHADRWMMEDVIRKELGFKGFYVSDWMDIERLKTRHFTANTQEEACFQTVGAGMDMHMHGPGYSEPLIKMVREGRLSEERINQSVRRILNAKFKLGLFETSISDIAQKDKILFNKAHKKAALEAAQKSIVLLKNDKNILPLSKNTYKRIFITGPNANSQCVTGDWSSKQADDHVITVLEGLTQIAGQSQIDYMDVGHNPRIVNKTHIKQAKIRAGKSDLAIVVVGENSFRWEWKDKTCGENSARSEISLAGMQKKLVQAVFESGTPTIVILVNGRPQAIEWISENIPAIVEAWEPGNMGGLAIAQVLFGEVNPSGKLPITIPRSAGHQLSVYNHKPTHYFHQYVTCESKPLYEFGYGLSYTEFNYQNLHISSQNININGSITLKIEVTNIGKHTGDEVVQLYIRDMVSSVTRPVKELKAFKRISLKANETGQVSFTITPEMLSFLDKNLKPTIEPGEFSVMVGGSSRDQDLICIPFYFN